MYPKIDLAGKKYRDWTVIRQVSHEKTFALWLVRCKCGTEKTFPSHYIRKIWKSQDCGCSKSIIGKQIGAFLILKKFGDGSNSKSKFLCKCHCGNERIYNGRNVLNSPRNSCGCERTKKVEDIGPARVMNHYIQASKSRKIEFSLSEKEFEKLISSKCAYCKKPPSSKYKMNECSTVPLRVFIYNGLDRVDNSKGYISGNCVPCCKRCNQMKNDMSLSEWLSQMRLVLANFQK